MNILSAASFKNISVFDYFCVEIITMGSDYFQNTGGLSVLRMKQRREEMFASYLKSVKTMSNGEKMPRSWMDCSFATEKLYCFCCQHFAICGADTLHIAPLYPWFKVSSNMQACMKNGISEYKLSVGADLFILVFWAQKFDVFTACSDILNSLKAEVS